MLNQAKRNQWIKQTPIEFARKNELIKSSDRKKRNVFLTFNQEIKLLRACETVDTYEHSSLSLSIPAPASEN